MKTLLLSAFTAFEAKTLKTKDQYPCTTKVTSASTNTYGTKHTSDSDRLLAHYPGTDGDKLNFISYF